MNTRDRRSASNGAGRAPPIARCSSTPTGDHRHQVAGPGQVLQAEQRDHHPRRPGQELRPSAGRPATRSRVNSLLSAGGVVLAVHRPLVPVPDYRGTSSGRDPSKPETADGGSIQRHGRPGRTSCPPVALDGGHGLLRGQCQPNRAGMLRAAVYSPTAMISTANAIRSVSGRARVAILAPSRLPITAAAVNTPMTVQSMSMPPPARATSEVPLLMAMTSREVPTATGIGKSSTSTSAGTTRNPQPTPKNPVTNPTTTAATSTFAARGQAQTNRGVKVMIGTSNGTQSAMPLPPPAGTRLRLRVSINAATVSISTENPASSTSGRTASDNRVPATAPAVPSAPKTTPCSTRT